jgi:hypothetical protein
VTCPKGSREILAHVIFHCLILLVEYIVQRSNARKSYPVYVCQNGLFYLKSTQPRLRNVRGAPHLSKSRPRHPGGPKKAECPRGFVATPLIYIILSLLSLLLLFTFHPQLLSSHIRLAEDQDLGLPTTAGILALSNSLIDHVYSRASWPLHLECDNI